MSILDKAAFKMKVQQVNLFPLKLSPQSRTPVWSVGGRLAILLQHMQPQ